MKNLGIAKVIYCLAFDFVQLGALFPAFLFTDMASLCLEYVGIILLLTRREAPAFPCHAASDV